MLDGVGEGIVGTRNPGGNGERSPSTTWWTGSTTIPKFSRRLMVSNFWPSRKAYPRATRKVPTGRIVEAVRCSALPDFVLHEAPIDLPSRRRRRNTIRALAHSGTFRAAARARSPLELAATARSTNATAERCERWNRFPAAWDLSRRPILDNGLFATLALSPRTIDGILGIVGVPNLQILLERPMWGIKTHARPQGHRDEMDATQEYEQRDLLSGLDADTIGAGTISWCEILRRNLGTLEDQLWHPSEPWISSAERSSSGGEWTLAPNPGRRRLQSHSQEG